MNTVPISLEKNIMGTLRFGRFLRINVSFKLILVAFTNKWLPSNQKSIFPFIVVLNDQITVHAHSGLPNLYEIFIVFDPFWLALFIPHSECASFHCLCKRSWRSLTVGDSQLHLFLISCFSMLNAKLNLTLSPFFCSTKSCMVQEKYNLADKTSAEVNVVTM